MKTVRTRKKSSNISEAMKLEIVNKYMNTDLTNKQLAEEYKTSEKNIELIVSRHWKALTNVRETKNLVGDQMNNLNHKGGNYHALKAIQKVPSINKEFLMLLSEPDDYELTDNELQYCYVFLATGDNTKALQESGLHVNLMGSPRDKEKHSFDLACRLRGMYIRKKKNIAKYLQSLKEKQYIPEIVNKEFIQRELLEQLEHQKELAVSSREINKTIEMLGRTVGAFSDVIKVQEVDPAQALDYLSTLARADAHLVESEQILLEDSEEWEGDEQG